MDSCDSTHPYLQPVKNAYECVSKCAYYHLDPAHINTKICDGVSCKEDYPYHVVHSVRDSDSGYITECVKECPYDQRYIGESKKCTSTCESGNYNTEGGKLFCTQVCPQFYIQRGGLKECTSTCDMYVLEKECVTLCPSKVFIRVGNDAQC